MEFDNIIVECPEIKYPRPLLFKDLKPGEWFIFKNPTTFEWVTNQPCIVRSGMTGTNYYFNMTSPGTYVGNFQIFEVKRIKNLTVKYEFHNDL